MAGMQRRLALLAALMVSSCATAPQRPTQTAAPVPGDANFPTEERSARHAEKVAQVRAGHFDLVGVNGVCLTPLPFHSGCLRLEAVEMASFASAALAKDAVSGCSADL